MPIVYLVSCTKKKNSKVARAEDLYSASARFRYSKAIAEREGDAWFVLSAKHHLVEPSRYLQPYECSLYSMKAPERRAWASKVLAQLGNKLHPGDMVVILAGERYYEFIRPELEKEYRVETPLAHMDRGTQLRWLKEHAGQ